MPDKRSNVLVFCTDQQRADHLGCAGHPVLRTPHIDALAARGVRFGNCYTTYPACMPARGSMLTGLSHRAGGMRSNGIGLSASMPTVPTLLQGAGYRTHAVGKLHLRPWHTPTWADLRDWEKPADNPERILHWKDGSLTRSPGNYHGFETMELAIGHVTDMQGDHRVWLDANYPDAARHFFPPEPGCGIRASEGAPAWEIHAPAEAHYNHWIADRTIAFLREADRQQPFFLWCSFPDPHAPFASLERWARVYRDADFDVPDVDAEAVPERLPADLLAARGGAENFTGQARAYHRRMRDYYVQTFGMISHIDEQIGRVMAELKASGQEDDTVILFLSDHGDQLGEHGFMHKGYWPFDGNARVPFILAGPGVDQPGRVEDKVVSLLDMAPTLLDAAGVNPPEDPIINDDFRAQIAPVPNALPGESLWRCVTDAQAHPTRGCALFETDDEHVTSTDLLQMRVLVTDDYKLSHYSPSGEVMLIDRRADPAERRNLASDPAHAATVTQMLSRLTVEINRTEARLPRRHTNA